MVLTATLGAEALAMLVTEVASEGEVTLPLRDYLALVEQVEAAEATAREREASREAPVAELASQQMEITWSDQSVAITTRYEVEVRGEPTPSVLLPLTGLAESSRVEPYLGSALLAAEGGLRFFAPSPGRYRVEVRSRVSTDRAGGADVLEVAPLVAPVAALRVDVPADRRLSCPGAVIAEDVVREERRQVRLSLPRNQAVPCRVIADRLGDGAQQILANAVVVTVVDLTIDGPVRKDVVLYEVARGELAGFLVTLPEGLRVERARTDEGDVLPSVIGREVTALRTQKLSGVGYLVLTSRPADPRQIDLEPVRPSQEVRARYLGLATSVAADLDPRPAAAWARVDLGDLPAALDRAIGPATLVAAWRRKEGWAEGEPLVLNTAILTPPPVLETVVSHRESLTLLTAEGTVLHRDRLTVAEGEMLRMRLPRGAALWSAQVDGQPVRPVERGGWTSFPASLAGGDQPIVEVVSVESRDVTEPRTLRLSLPELESPVLHHTWRLLLPEGQLYRFQQGDLSPVPESLVDGKAIEAGPGGRSSVRGRVLDSTGGWLPGATVTLTHLETGWTGELVADASGRFLFRALPRGRYRLSGSLAGFRTQRYEFELSSGVAPHYTVVLEVGELTETVMVTAAADDSTESLEAEEFTRQRQALRQGLVGGVRPVPVSIPESGRVLLLTGALPPQRVGVELETKPR